MSYLLWKHWVCKCFLNIGRITGRIIQFSSIDYESEGRKNFFFFTFTQNMILEHSLVIAWYKRQNCTKMKSKKKIKRMLISNNFKTVFPITPLWLELSQLVRFNSISAYLCQTHTATLKHIFFLACDFFGTVLKSKQSSEISTISETWNQLHWRYKLEWNNLLCSFRWSIFYEKVDWKRKNLLGTSRDLIKKKKKHRKNIELKKKFYFLNKMLFQLKFVVRTWFNFWLVVQKFLRVGNGFPGNQ